MFSINSAQVATISTLMLAIGCATTNNPYKVKVTLYNADVNQPVAGEKVVVSYARSEVDKFFKDRPEGDGRIYTTDEKGQFIANVYSVEDATIVIAIGAAIYYIDATAIEFDAEITRGEDDRISPRREIPYPIDLTFEVIE